MEPFPSFGGAAFSPKSKLFLRLILQGCTNRPFFHMVVQEYNKEAKDPVIEQIGNYDPLPNNHNEKLIAINFQRLEYWIRRGVTITTPVRELLDSFMEAYRRRKELSEEIEKLKIQAAKFVPNPEKEPEKLNNEPSSGA